MSPPTLRGNWVDLIILLVLFYFLTVGWTVGFWAILGDFLSFLLSLLIALRGYQLTAGALRTNFALSHSVSNALGFLFTAIIAEAILGYLFNRLIKKIPLRCWKKWWVKPLGLWPAISEGLIITAFVLTIIIALPVSPSVKTDITESKLGGVIVQKTAGVEMSVNDIFGGVIEDSLTYLTVKPGSRERVPLTVEVRDLRIDEASENQMFSLINNERKERGVPELTWREEVVPVARAHARDMWEKSYFGHVSPDEEDVGDRLVKEEVKFIFAGENLALAPTLSTAHTGLMNSPGHRENILDGRFKRIGIGIIDNGVYGKMFVQVFTD